MSESKNNSKNNWAWGEQPKTQPEKHPIDLHPESTRFLACGYDAEMKPFEKGDWIRYVDYELVKSDVKGLTKELADAQESYHLVNDRVNILVKENARLKAECQARQAENSVLAVECDSLKAEVERLTADLNKMTKTPEGVDYVEVNVGFWTKSGSRLPSSYSTFWSNDKGVQS